MTTFSDIQTIARDYYNSDDADLFYVTVWGGEDLHLGIYEEEDDSIFDASRRTVERMASHVGRLGDGIRVLDLGGGFGGTARYLAKHYGCHVTVINLSERENERSRRMNEDQKLGHLVKVVDGTFEALPFPDASFDVIWSQDAILHSEDRGGVLREAYRVVVPGGDVIFTDPMQADTCPTDVLQPILERIHLASLGSPEYYLSMAVELGLEVVNHVDLSPHLTRHYSRVLEETVNREDELQTIISSEYLDRMKAGLGHWINGGEKGYLAWGIFHLRKAS